MPVQTRLLIAFLAAAFCLGTGAYLGYQYADGRNAKAAAEAKDAALEDARRVAEAEKQDAVERVRREAVAAERARTAHSKGVTDAHLKARPDCGRDTESHRLLLDAIDAANGTQARPGGVPEAVPAKPRTERWLGLRN